MKVVHCKREKFDVYIGRPSKWGNPFEIGKDGTREEVIEKHKEWLPEQPQLLADLHELRGRILGCWCTPKPCHGDILLEWANLSIKDFKLKIETINATHTIDINRELAQNNLIRQEPEQTNGNNN